MIDWRRSRRIEWSYRRRSIFRGSISGRRL